MLKLVVFDFDGVIADSEPAHFEMFRRLLSEEGIDIDWAEYMEKYLGYSDYDFFREFFGKRGVELNEKEIQYFIARKAEKFADYIACHSVIFPGVRALLEDLRANNILCSICSGALKGEIDFILRQVGGLADYFTAIVAAEDVSRGKPYPDGYSLSLARTNEALERPDIMPDETIAIEDSVWGIRAAAAAGMRRLGVTTTYQADQLDGADHIEPNLKTVNTELLRKIVGNGQ